MEGIDAIRSSPVVLTEAGPRLHPVFVRYAWPAELDAMALVAGLVLVDRFGDDRRPFEASSRRHVSVYRREVAELARSWRAARRLT